MSDLEAPTTNSGGRKARPYGGQVNPFCRGGGYLPAIVLRGLRRGGRVPARKEAIVPLILALESLNLGFNMLPWVWLLKKMAHFVLDAPFDAEILLTWGGVPSWNGHRARRQETGDRSHESVGIGHRA